MKPENTNFQHNECIGRHMAVLDMEDTSFTGRVTYRPISHSIKYRYIGPKKHLKGKTALGAFRHGWFKVQVDDTSHRYAFGWWAQNPQYWEPVLVCEPRGQRWCHQGN